MPGGGGHHGGGHHGGGHHGGGHHGGGHHGGGHHWGGHHHHGGYHHHNHLHGGGYYGYGRRRHLGVFYYSPFRWFYRGFVLLVSIIIIGIVFLSVGLSQVFSGPSNHRITASPQDDRPLSYSQSSCGSIEVSTNQNEYPVMLYLMRSAPAVTDGANFQISNNWYLGRGDYRYYYFYLLPQSTISISLYSTYNSVTLYILSSSQFAKFENDDYFTYKYYKRCTSTSSSSPCQYSYPVTTGDEHYIVFDETVAFTTVSSTLTIQKKKYVIESSDIYENCTAGCSLSVPGTPTLYPVVITGDVIDADWTASVPYTWHCTSGLSVPTWVYVLVVVGVLVLIASVVGLIATAVFLCHKKRITQHSEPLLTTPPQVPPTATHATYQPPPVAPNYPTQSAAPSAPYQQPPPVVPSYPNYAAEQPPSYGWVSKN